MVVRMIIRNIVHQIPLRVGRIAVTTATIDDTAGLTTVVVVVLHDLKHIPIKQKDTRRTKGDNERLLLLLLVSLSLFVYVIRTPPKEYVEGLRSVMPKYCPCPILQLGKDFSVPTYPRKRIKTVFPDG